MLRLVVFACVGAAMEVVFTAATDFIKTRDARLKGFTYIWMLPLYALAPLFLDALYPRIEGLWIGLRLTLYTALLMAMEYASGRLLKAATGVCPWEPEYRGKRWAIHGLVRLDYAPAWAAACFLFERLYLAL